MFMSIIFKAGAEQFIHRVSYGNLIFCMVINNDEWGNSRREKSKKIVYIWRLGFLKIFSKTAQNQTQNFNHLNRSGIKNILLLSLTLELNSISCCNVYKNG